MLVQRQLTVYGALYLNVHTYLTRSHGLNYARAVSNRDALSSATGPFRPHAPGRVVGSFGMYRPTQPETDET